MEIERINEHTVKLYISYVDIEERGFDREEIWYNRERSEELFWEMMEEIHNEDGFITDGPLWIQIQALDKGLEVIVTKAQISKDGQRLELPLPDDKHHLQIEHDLEDILDQNFHMHPYGKSKTSMALDIMVRFKDIEDVISLAKRPGLEQLHSKLYHFENRYYVYIQFPEDTFDEEQIENVLSVLLEYGEESTLTVHRLEEYGKLIMDGKVFSELLTYFS